MKATPNADSTGQYIIPSDDYRSAMERARQEALDDLHRWVRRGYAVCAVLGLIGIVCFAVSALS